MAVDTHHPKYDASLSKWTLVRDCVAGAKAVRSKGVTYLPNPDAENDVNNQSQRYKDYKTRAQFVNVTARTRNAMVGMAFRNPPEIEVPSGLDYLIENATGEGRSLEQLGKDVVGDELEVGRIGLLTDYPQADEGLTQAQVRALNLQANIKVYPAECIINWKTTTVGGEEILSLVVLKESYNVSEDEYGHDTGTQYRVLKLEEGRYVVEIWRDDGIYAAYEPKQGNGQHLDRIPFIIAGTYNNNADVDDAALYDIAELNIGHYRNSADYEEGVFLHGQPMLQIDPGEITAAEWKEFNPNGIEVGARRGIVARSATLLQAESNSAAFEAMQDKLKDMLAIGARLIQENGQAETAEAARIKHAGDNSVLTNVVQNASDAIKQAIEWCGWFMNVTGEIVFQINEDFYDKEASPQLIMAKIQLLDRGIIGKSDLRSGLRQAGQLERMDEEIDEEVGEVSPLE